MDELCRLLHRKARVRNDKQNACCVDALLWFSAIARRVRSPLNTPIQSINSYPFYAYGIEFTGHAQHSRRDAFNRAEARRIAVGRVTSLPGRGSVRCSYNPADKVPWTESCGKRTLFQISTSKIGRKTPPSAAWRC